MLVVTTTVSMVDGVHSNTTSAGPAEVHGQREFTVNQTMNTHL